MRLVHLLTVLMLATPVLADDAADKTGQSAYVALAASQAKADHAVREARDVFSHSQNAWRESAQATEAARGRIDEALARAIDAEGRKTDDQRDPKVIEATSARRAAIEAEWQTYTNVTRPALEASYRSAADAATNLHEVFENLAAVEKGLKDAKVDLAPLAALYDNIAAKAADAQAQGEKALAQLQAVQKEWETRPGATTQPAR